MSDGTQRRRSGIVNVFFLGMVSFFADISTEMVYPIIPLYLMAAFGATPALVGVIEGIAESVASLLKVFSGYVSDRFAAKKPLAFGGYAAGVVYKVALIVAGSWAGILGARVIDRIGKGIRTSPRDVMVAESTDGQAMGRSFGLHKALDMFGSALGILATYFILRGMHDSFDYRSLFLYSTIPGVLSLVMFVFIKEKKHTVRPKREPFWKDARRIDGQLKLYLVVCFLFTLGNSSNAFILIRAKASGFDDVSVILLYFLFNLVASVLAVPAGQLSDKIGRKKLLVGGYLVFSACYLGFAFSYGQWLMVATFVLYGAYTAMITGVERAFVAEIAPPDLKGTMLGLQSTVVGVALLPASIIAGVLWDVFGSWTTFAFGAALSFAAAMILLVFMRPIATSSGGPGTAAA